MSNKTTKKAQKTKANNSAERARRVFLTALAEGDSVVEAAEKSTYTRMQIYRWRHELPEFAKDWDLAQATLADELHTHAKAIALGDGLGAPAMLQFLLKAADPERFCSAVRAKKWELRYEGASQIAALGGEGSVKSKEALAEVLTILDNYAKAKQASASASAVDESYEPLLQARGARELPPMDLIPASKPEAPAAIADDDVDIVEPPVRGKNHSDWSDPNNW